MIGDVKKIVIGASRMQAIVRKSFPHYFQENVEVISQP